MAFRVLNYEEARQVDLPVGGSSIVWLKGAAAVHTSGLMALAAADQNGSVHYICDETITTGSAAGDIVRFLKVGNHVRISADCEDAPAQDDVGTLCDLAGASSLDPNSATDALFFIEAIDLQDGAVATSTVVTGYFQSAQANAL